MTQKSGVGKWLRLDGLSPETIFLEFMFHNTAQDNQSSVEFMVP